MAGTLKGTNSHSTPDAPVCNASASEMDDLSRVKESVYPRLARFGAVLLNTSLSLIPSSTSLMDKLNISSKRR